MILLARNNLCILTSRRQSRDLQQKANNKACVAVGFSRAIAFVLPAMQAANNNTATLLISHNFGLLFLYDSS